MSQSHSSYGNLIIVSGPSAVGKTTLVECALGLYVVRPEEAEEELPQEYGRLFTVDAEETVSHTTRPARAGEYDGVHYRFVAKDQFESLIAAGRFLEYAEVFGHYYGTSCDAVYEITRKGHDAIAIVDVQGHASIRARVDELAAEGAPICQIMSVFIDAPSRSALRQRLHERGASPHEIARRIAEMPKEQARRGEYDLVLVNDDLERSSTCLAQLMFMLRDDQGFEVSEA